MNCPVCDGVKMREVEKEQIMIDICPSCKGVWLDRGELDKLMQGVREVREPFNQWYEGHETRRTSKEDEYDKRYNKEHDQRRPYPEDYNRHYNPKYKKKKSVMDIFGDLFD
ncbi:MULTISPECIES: zf-TFIIB domain-containing protein [unclassified Paenibacillus]|uniref:TFIIB-type zinc ribbon-containing protein n=1 Tax=unclassified Paenibacillus TaxID=185978 RepID=UPI001AE29095|nr:MULTISPECIES: zf-TFIIB domain-containing protein [unclassified Paenibacillus]MBP1156414.1 Zn-finger nucleic acid-binding protein [Paenibacillus sp. PvP091]MBP1168200.1 Zn-finger nucleic acid-binding protein [Paenibacillus sp. PvR098]MBP2439228.1 Zn-finger nucleic acid-binding protein [Paenibacillus sp. PvP052]